MKINLNKTEELLPVHLSGRLSDIDRTIFDYRIKRPTENVVLYRENLTARDAIASLHEMGQFSSFLA